jgi:hypothetical protein
MGPLYAVQLRIVFHIANVIINTIIIAGVVDIGAGWRNYTGKLGNRAQHRQVVPAQLRKIGVFRQQHGRIDEGIEIIKGIVHRLAVISAVKEIVAVVIVHN